MKQLYDFCLKFSKYSFFTPYIIYVAIRTAVVFLPTLLTSLFLKGFVHIPAVSPSVFVVIFTGWITLIFGFWGALFYLMRREP